MEQGLAHSYAGTESQNTTKHHYDAKSVSNNKRKKGKKPCKTKK